MENCRFFVYEIRVIVGFQDFVLPFLYLVHETHFCKLSDIRKVLSILEHYFFTFWGWVDFYLVFEQHGLSYRLFEVDILVCLQYIEGIEKLISFLLLIFVVVWAAFLDVPKENLTILAARANSTMILVQACFYLQVFTFKSFELDFLKAFVEVK